MSSCSLDPEAKEINTIRRVRFTLNQIEQETIFETISNPYHSKDAVPPMVQQMKAIRAAIDSLSDGWKKEFLEARYYLLKSIFCSNEHVKAYLFNCSL